MSDAHLSNPVRTMRSAHLLRPNLPTGWARALGGVLLLLLLGCWPLQVNARAGAPIPTCEYLLQQGGEHRLRGELALAVQSLKLAHDLAATPEEKGRTAAALGTALLQQQRLAEALPFLEEAIASPAPGDVRAMAANDLGNLHAQEKRYDAAESGYVQALRLAPEHAALAVAVELNRLRLPAAAHRAGRLQTLFDRLRELGDLREHARYSLNIAGEAKALGEIALAYQAFDKARELADRIQAPRLLAEAFDGLAQLYEERKRDAEAMRLTRAGIDQARSADARDLLIQLEWRQARLWQTQGNARAAIAALANAVGHIEAIRQDLPVTYQDGRSSFRDTLAPIYHGLADLLLRQASTQQGVERGLSLRQARETVELVKQTELEDFLGNRCGVGAARLAGAAGGTARLSKGTAVLYPILLAERIELLLETVAGMEQVTVAANMAQFERTVRDFVFRLGDYALNPGARSKQLYQLLLAPLEANLKRLQVHTLVIVPDGILRMVPFAALHDGQDYLIQRYAMATAPALTLLNRSTGSRQGANVLLAGMSEPGAVVDKLTPLLLETILPPGAALPPQPAAPGKRAVRRALAVDAAATIDNDIARRDALKKSLSLPGVKSEVEDLARITGGETLLDAGFTLDSLRRQVGSGNYRIVHLATHGVFGPTADTTFVMTHDDLLTLDRLQELVRKQSSTSARIDLLTLSACQTAQGDDRAPLGLAGAALQARAGSALGSLWPVSDEAAARLMGDFYARLARRGSKAQALQESQIALLKDPQFSHPFFWAPFILVGDWQ